MQELLTAVTYLVVWLICSQVLEIESGFVTHVISLSAAIGVYILISVKEQREGKYREKDGGEKNIEGTRVVVTLKLMEDKVRAKDPVNKN